MTSQKLIDVVEKLKECGQVFPEHDLKNQETVYIDYLGLENNPVKHHIVRGIDKYDRSFFAFKVIIHAPRGPIFLMDTVFQRFSDRKYNWVICGHYSRNTLLAYGGVEPCQLQFYVDLICKGRAIITKKMRPQNKHHVGLKVTIGDRESLAASLIQRNWKTCRDNPEYYMCSRVQIRDLMNHNSISQLENVKSLFPKWTEEEFNEVFPDLLEDGGD
jgi:hypothetical protein